MFVVLLGCSGEYKAEVGLLTRRILFTSDERSTASRIGRNMQTLYHSPVVGNLPTLKVCLSNHTFHYRAYNICCIYVLVADN